MEKILYKYLHDELQILNSKIIMFASASLPFKSVYDILAYPVNFNPAEGSVGKRYFAGCDNIDYIEELTQNLTLHFFNLDSNYYACVQPYSGSQANHIVYNAILKNKQSTVLSMSTNAGGHVSHSKYLKNFYTLLTYGTDQNGIINYEEIERLCANNTINLLIAGASSYPRFIDYEKLSKICIKHNVKLLADISHTVIYSSVLKEFNPFPYADFCTFTTHKTTRGIRGGIIVCKKEYEQLITQSCFPLTQGAIKFNEILAKAMMFIELNKRNLNEFINKIKSFTNYFVNFMRQHKVDMFTGGSDMHYVTLYFTNGLTGKQAENRLSKIDILTNANKVKIADKTYEGIRIGFLVLACIDFSMNDFKFLTQIIYDVLFTATSHTKIEINSLISKYDVLSKIYGINISNVEK